MANGGEVDVIQLVQVEALVHADVGWVEDGEGESRKAAHVYFVEGKPGGGADGVVVGALDVQQVYVPVCLLSVADHGEYLSHDVVNVLDSAVGARVVGARGDLVDAEVWSRDGDRFRKGG